MRMLETYMKECKACNGCGKLAVRVSPDSHQPNVFRYEQKLCEQCGGMGMV